MKTASIQDLPQGFPAILTWLQAGETIVLLQTNGRPLGRIIPEARAGEPEAMKSRSEQFARRFAPLAAVPDRDLSDIVTENRGNP